MAKSRNSKRLSPEKRRRHRIIDERSDEDTEGHYSENEEYINHIAINKNDIYNEMINNQLEDIPRKWKLTESDINRVCQYIDESIFSKDIDRCCIWKGYITNVNNSNKGTYVNFYFNRKKMALHRLLYANFVDNLSDNEYIKFKCKNKGTCCNVNHYEKYTYSSSAKKIKKKQEKDPYMMEITFDEDIDISIF